MKNKITFKKKILFLVIAGIAHLITSAQTQKNRYTYQLSAGVLTSGNGHGVYYHLEIALKKNQHTLELMPLYQVLNRKINGFQLNYIKSLTPEIRTENPGSEKRRFAPWCFLSGGYLTQAVFTQTIVCKEINADNEIKTTPATPTANTLQLGFGLGGTLNLINNLVLKTFISGGVYIHNKFPQLRSHKKYGPSITIGAALGIGKVRW